MSTALRDGIQRLEVTSRVTIGVLALASGVYTYLGVRELLNGNTTTVFFAAVIYSVAGAIGVFAFWAVLMRLLPHVLDLDPAHRYALSAPGPPPRIQMASARFSQLADGEKTGTLTGTSGSGTVVQLLTQMSNQLAALSRTVDRSSDQVKALYEQGEKHLAKMRELVSSRGPVGPRSDAFGTEATALLGIIASLQQTSVASSVQRTADDLAAGFIAPAAGGRSADLAERQTAVVTRVQEAVAAQSKALSVAAGKIVADKPPEPTRFVPLSSAEAVVRYAGDFIPSWAGAISIDLMPAVLVLILCVAHASIRRQATPASSLSSMTASELITAIRLAREVEAEQEVGRRRSADADMRAAALPEEQEQVREPDENVTPLALATARAAAAKKD